MARRKSQPNSPGAARSVFLNCPFDDEFRPLLRAIVFTIVACGFTPRCALERLDGGEYRLDKIARMIGDCDWGIHDISRVEVDPADPVPRFNMPLELGVHLGARFLGAGRHRRKKALILESAAHRYDKTLSDISGQDIAQHDNDPAKAIQAVRDFFNNHRVRGTPALPGAKALMEDYVRLRSDIGPGLAEAQRLGNWENLSFRDYVELVEAGLEVLAKWRAQRKV
ncbi:MAG: hypothetical protein ABSD74_11460 [Rhizomicrobium sp.]